MVGGGDSRRNQDGGKGRLRTFCTMVFMKEIDKNALGEKVIDKLILFLLLDTVEKPLGLS